MKKNNELPFKKIERIYRGDRGTLLLKPLRYTPYFKILE
jgi:hypothetical protein